MATLQHKSSGWYLQFRYKNQRYTLSLGPVEEVEAIGKKAKAEKLLRLIKDNLLDLPGDVDIRTFLQYDGKPPAKTPEPKKEWTLGELSETYLKICSRGALEANTVKTSRLHLNHLAETLGKRFNLNALCLNDLQKHVDRRLETVQAVTVKKELATFRTLHNWAKRTAYVDGDYPQGKLIFHAKAKEKPPFMTWEEIERRISQGGDPKELWECLYLTDHQIEELLDHAQQFVGPEYYYAMFVMAAHTGARRSKLLRAECQHVDLTHNTVDIQEKKRVRGTYTSRRVPLSERLKVALTPLVTQDGRKFLFGPEGRNISTAAATELFNRVLSGSRWEKVRGWHVLRHSFCSALASRGVDERVIRELVGHQTEAMARRYQHLIPSTKEQAIRSVFG